MEEKLESVCAVAGGSRCSLHSDRFVGNHEMNVQNAAELLIITVQSTFHGYTMAFELKLLYLVTF